MKIAYIRWTDALHQRGPLARDEMRWTVLEVELVGMLLDISDKIVTVAADWASDYETYRDITHIPCENILEMRVIDVNKMRCVRRRK